MRLRTTAFLWSNSYFDAATGETVEVLHPFNVLSDLKIARRQKDGHVTSETGYFRFHDAIVKNLLAYHTKPLLFDVVLSFQSEIAQILYTHLDLILSDKASYERKTVELFEDLGLEGREYGKMSVRARRLGPALKELQGVRLTTGTITKAALEKTRDGADFKAVFRKGRTAAAEPGEGAGARAEVPAPPAKDGRATEAEELVRHFHRVFHRSEEAMPTSKALDQAASLVARLGFEKAQHVVDFAHAEAPKTRHRVATFGGVIQYTTPALRDFEKNQGERDRRRKAQAAIDA